MAFAAYDGATLIGVHFTQLDQSAARINGAWAQVQLISAGGHHVYAAGPGWNANLLINLAPAPASFNTGLAPAGSDIQATLAGRAVTLAHRPHAGGGPWVAIPFL